MRVRGLVVMIVACQVMGFNSRRTHFCSTSLLSTPTISPLNTLKCRNQMLLKNRNTRTKRARVGEGVAQPHPNTFDTVYSIADERQQLEYRINR